MPVDYHGTPRFLLVAPAANRLDAHAPEQADHVQKRLAAPVHGLVARDRDHVESTVGEEGGKTRILPAVMPVRVHLHCASRREHLLAMGKANIGLRQRGLCQHRVSVQRLVIRPDISDRHQQQRHQRHHRQLLPSTPPSASQVSNWYRVPPIVSRRRKDCHFRRRRATSAAIPAPEAPRRYLRPAGTTLPSLRLHVVPETDTRRQQPSWQGHPKREGHDHSG